MSTKWFTNLKAAMNNLKGEPLKLWIYLSLGNEPSQKALESWGLRKDAYYSALSKLKELKYLDNEMNFIENPQILGK